MSSRNYFKMTFFIFFVLLCKMSFSQQNEDLIGHWKITKVELVPNAGQEERQMLATLTKLFLKSTFHFKNNSLCSFDSPDKYLAIKDAIWKFDSTKKYIQIVERPIKGKGRPGVLMEINVKVTDGQYLFYMQETPVILTVIKK
jgi:hypothetical protein